VEAVSEEIGAIKSWLWEYYRRDISQNGMRLLRACGRQLDRIDGVFYERSAEQTIQYAATIMDDAYAILEREFSP
jgi:hypothetical protein